MPLDVLVRPTSAADLSAITAIYAEAVHTGSGSFELEAPTLVEMTRRWRNRADKGFPHIVATSGEVVLGYAYISRHRTSPAYRHLVENSIYVISHAQGAGVGRVLLSALIESCEALAFRQMVALIAEDNVPSVRLHDHLGFRPVGVLNGSAFKHGQWINTLLMQRSLGDGDRSPPIDL